MANVPSKFEGVSLNSDRQIQIVTGQIKKGLVVVFLSSKCPCSHSHIKELVDLHNQFKDFEFLAIHSNADESIEEAKDYFKQLKLPFEVLKDEKSVNANLLSASKTPHAFVISQKGEILYNGGVTDSSEAQNASEYYLRKALENLSQGKKVVANQKRTLGCAISRGK